jgi:hypothetical protein
MRGGRRGASRHGTRSRVAGSNPAPRISGEKSKPLKKRTA